MIKINRICLYKPYNYKHIIRCFSDYLNQYQEILHRVKEYGQQPYRNNDARVGFEPVSRVVEEREKSSRMTNISKAMNIYLEQAKKYNEFIQEKNEEFEMGRRHLANIMGIDEALMTQKDIDLAIEYLMPSALYEKKARPVMKPPSEIFPRQVEAKFNIEGRPNHFLFYTARPNFYETCYNIQQHLEELYQFEDRLIRKGVIEPPTDAKIELTASRWLNYEEMKSYLAEKLDEQRYEYLIDSLNHLVSHSYSKRCEDFILKFRKEIKEVTAQMKIPPLMYDDDGRPYMTAVGRRKYCIAYVTVRGNGTGKVDINGKDITYFEILQDREQVMAPLKFCNLLFKVDIECKTVYEEETKPWIDNYHGIVNKDWYWTPDITSTDMQLRKAKNPWKRELGTTAQSGAIRQGLALALRSFMDKQTVEYMRLAGLLTIDSRKRERKRWGREGARRKYTWKKR